jgi:hypothetical protein
MMPRLLQMFSAVLLFATHAAVQGAELQRGSQYPFTLRDVDGNNLATADGHVTIITVVTRENEKQARAIATGVPRRVVGDPKYRYITLVNFQRKLSPPFRGITNGIIRRRLDAEAKELQATYTAKQLTRDPRRDVFVVADFDGSAVAHLGLTPNLSEVAVFVFDGGGKLIERWTGVPPPGALARAIAAAE